MTEQAASIKDILIKNGLDHTASDEICEKLASLTDELLRVNAHTNLTAIKEPSDIAAKHYADCLFAEDLIPSGAALADIGCGGGFPTLPLAIARPDIKITAIDSTAKKIAFVQSAADTLGLSNVTATTGRAEAFARRREYRERFGVVISRAVAALPVLAELCLPFVRTGGIFIAMKGTGADDELAAASGAIAKLGGKVSDMRAVSLVSGEETLARKLIVIKKTSRTPEAYPRDYSKISKKPL